MTPEQNVGNDPYPNAIVRDYLYVDLARARSLLAQMAGGAGERIIERSQNARALSARLGLWGNGLEASASRGTEYEETRSLTDLHFALLEETAEALGMLTDISDQTSAPADWDNGTVAANLEEGQMVRITCPVRLVDSSHIQQSLERVDNVIDAWISVMGATAPSERSGDSPAPIQPPSPRDRGNAQRREQQRRSTQEVQVHRQSREAKKQELLGGYSDQAIASIRNLLGGLLEEGVSVRAMPCGGDHPDRAFLGTLLPRSEYIDPERSALFGRLGVRPTVWTLVGIVSRIPGREDEALSIDPTTAFSRANLEGMVLALLDQLEKIGLTGSASWPSIGILPIALYRPLIVAGGSAADD